MAINKTSVKDLVDLYLGESVILYLKNMNIVVASEESTLEVTPMLTGILMDVSQDHLHLGDGEIVLKSIRHEDYGVIEIELADMGMGLDLELATRDEDIN